MEALARDVRHGVALLLRDRLFSVAAIATLALCIGASAAIFGVVNAVLLRPLPFTAPDELVLIYNSYPKAGVERAGAAAPDLTDRAAHVPALATLSLQQTAGVTIGEEGFPERVTALRGTPSLLPLLGVAPALGRGLTEEESAPGAAPAALISWGLWLERYGARPDVLGSTVRVNAVEHEIVGVLPRGFVLGPTEPRLLLPLVLTPAMLSDESRHSNNYLMLGRLAPGASLPLAQAQIDELNRRNDERFPEFRPLLEQAGFHTVVSGYHQEMTRDVRGTLLLLQAGVFIVLLIGCVNIANLVLVRSTSRSRELATRAALGAGTARLARQLAVESVVLSVAGGAAGLAIGWGGLRLFATMAAERLPGMGGLGVDLAVLGVTLLLSLVAGLLFALLPIARLRRADLATVFREDGRATTASRTALTARGTLVVAQVALAFTLLIGAGLTIATFLRTTAVDPGFEPRGVASAAVSLPGTRYTTPEQRLHFFDAALERTRALPGVQAAGYSLFVPFGNEMNFSVVTADGQVARAGDPPLVPAINAVSAGWFETMGVQLVAGRFFDETDRDGALEVVVIDESLARLMWPGEDALGRRAFIGAYDLGMPDSAIVMRTVVGIVRPGRVTSLTDEQGAGQFFVPFAQQSAARAYYAVRTTGDPHAVVPSLRRIVADQDGDLPVYDVSTMEERLSSSLLALRLRTTLLVAFSGLALLLAAVGLYGVLAYSVAQRSTELGIRMALGSSAPQIFRLVLVQGMRMVGIGIALGIAASLAGTRLLQGMLFGVSALDPSIFAAVFAILAAVAAAACALPAWRATRVEAAVALKR